MRKPAMDKLHQLRTMYCVLFGRRETLVVRRVRERSAARRGLVRTPTPAPPLKLEASSLEACESLRRVSTRASCGSQVMRKSLMPDTLGPRR